MPITPRFNPQDVHDIAPIPGVRNTTVVRPGASLSEAVAPLAKMAEDHGAELRDRADEAAVMEAHAKVNEAEYGLFDPANESGAAAYGGLRAKEGQPVLLQQRDAVAQQVRQGLNERQMRAFDKIDYSARDQFEGRLHSWSTKEYEGGLKAKEEAVQQSFLKVGIQSALNGDHAAAEDNLGKAMSAVEIQALRETGSPEAAANAADGARSGFHYNVAMGLLQQPGGVQAAKDYIDKYGAQITDPAQHRAVMNTLQPALDAIDDESFAKAAVEGGQQAVSDSNSGTPTFPVTETNNYVHSIKAMLGDKVPTGTNAEVAAKVMDSLVKQESGGKQGAVSKKGALGVAQLMPATARELERQLGMKPHQTDTDPIANRKAGQEYLKQKLDDFNGNLDLALAAYNAGAGNVRHWIATKQVGAGTHYAKPQTLQEAIGAAEASTTDPVLRNRRVTAVKRTWAENKAIEADADRQTSEEIFTSIHDNKGSGKPFATLLTPVQRDWAVRNGHYETLEKAYVSSDAATTDPATANALDRAFYNATDPTNKNPAVARKALEAMNPFDPNLKLSDDDRRQYATARNSLLAKDGKADTKAKADWATEAQRVDASLHILGIDSNTNKKQKAEEEYAFRAAYRQAAQAYVQQFGKEPAGADADNMMRTVRANFARNRAAGTLRIYGALNERGSPIMSQHIEPGDIAVARANLKHKGLPSDDASVMAYIEHYYKGSNAN